jgi:thiol-disulfide isomerase/thioredoxin
VRARSFVVALAACAALATAAGCSTGSDAVNQMNGSDNGFVSAAAATKVYPGGDRPEAPAVSGTLLDGAKYNLASDHGHIVVMNFWGSWCAPCRKEAADLQSVHAATENAGVKFVGVNIRDEQDPANAYDQAHDITYPSIFDPSGRVALQFAQVPPSAIPSTLVIDATGHIAAIHLGSITAKQLTDMITAAS